MGGGGTLDYSSYGFQEIKDPKLNKATPFGFRV